MVDDALIPAINSHDCIKSVEKLLKLLADEGLTINLTKSKFFTDKITYLGHEISESGVKPGCKNIDAVKEFAQPTSITEIRRFLGLTGFFRNFLFQLFNYCKAVAHDVKERCKISMDRIRK